jgi:hypothetical protein
VLDEASVDAPIHRAEPTIQVDPDLRHLSWPFRRVRVVPRNLTRGSSQGRL